MSDLIRESSGRTHLVGYCGGGHEAAYLVQTLWAKAIGDDTRLVPTQDLIDSFRPAFASAHNLSFPNRFFAFAFCRQIIEHLSDPRSCMMEIAGAMRPERVL